MSKLNKEESIAAIVAAKAEMVTNNVGNFGCDTAIVSYTHPKTGVGR